MFDIVDFIAYELCFGDYYCDNCGELLLSYNEESNFSVGDTVSCECAGCGNNYIIEIDINKLMNFVLHM